MGIFHSRASKKRHKAEAKLLDEQRREIKRDRSADAAATRAAGAADRTKRAAGDS